MRRVQKNNFIKAYLLLSFQLFFLCAFSQAPAFKNYTPEDGLPSSECYQVLQDKKGFIWVITDRGVSRFDGYKFQNFTTKEGLPENSIMRMYEDPKGRIWFAGLTGQLAVFENEKISALKINDQLKDHIKAGIINSMAMISDTLYVGLHGVDFYLKIVYTNENKLSFETKKDIKTGGYVLELENGERLQGWIWNSVKSNRLTIQKNQKMITNKSAFPDLLFSRFDVRGLTVNSEKHLFLFNHLIVTYNPKTGEVLSCHEFDQINLFVFRDSKKGLWIGTIKNGVLYFPDGDLNKKPQVFLNDHSISGITEDKEGGIWITSLEQGLFYIENLPFYHFSNFSSSKVNTVTLSGDAIYTGLDNGYLVRIDKHMMVSEIDINRQKNVPNYIRKIEINPNGNVGISGINGFSVYSIKNKQVYWYKFDDHASNCFITSKLDDTYWSCNLHQIHNLRFTNNTFQKLYSLPAPPKCRGIAQDSKGTIWIASEGGLSYFILKGKKIIAAKDSLLKQKINDIKISNDLMWLAMKENGVIIRKDGVIYQINESQGLASDLCQSVFLENSTTGWICTTKGISKVQITCWKPFRFKITTYNTDNGLISNEVKQVWKQNNRVYIASNKGLTWFDENKIKPNRTGPPIYITGLSVNDSILQLKHFNQFTYDRNNITIHFVGLSYKNNGNTDYLYRLIGLDSVWKKTKYTKIDFTTLPYGDYTFEVKAKNSDGVWSTAPARIHFIIYPPFWHTWWFRILAGLLIISSIYLYIKYRIRIVEKRAKEKETLYKKAVEMELRFLSSQMNPHFTFNAMNSILHFMLENESEKAQSYLTKYSRLIRKVLENNMNKFVTLEDEISMLTLYMEMETLRFPVKFDFKIDVAAELKAGSFPIPPMIVQPYIENSIWHGFSKKEDGPGMIHLTFELENGSIKCTIEDNGIGRKKSRELNTTKKGHQSVGMNITQQRLQHLQLDSDVQVEPVITDLMDEHTNPCGTRIEIWLPVQS